MREERRARVMAVWKEEREREREGGRDREKERKKERKKDMEYRLIR